MSKPKLRIAFTSDELALNIETLAQRLEDHDEPLNCDTEIHEDYTHLSPEVKRIKKLWIKLIREERMNR